MFETTDIYIESTENANKTKNFNLKQKINLESEPLRSKIIDFKTKVKEKILTNPFYLNVDELDVIYK